MDRRKFVSSTAALAGLAAYGSFGQAHAQGTGPIKIGLLTPLTGVVAIVRTGARVMPMRAAACCPKRASRWCMACRPARR